MQMWWQGQTRPARRAHSKAMSGASCAGETWLSQVPLFARVRNHNAKREDSPRFLPSFLPSGSLRQMRAGLDAFAWAHWLAWSALQGVAAFYGCPDIDAGHEPCYPRAWRGAMAMTLSSSPSSSSCASLLSPSIPLLLTLVSLARVLVSQGMTVRRTLARVQHVKCFASSSATD
jgi:hypothetical protein